MRMQAARTRWFTIRLGVLLFFLVVALAVALPLYYRRTHPPIKQLSGFNQVATEQEVALLVNAERVKVAQNILNQDETLMAVARARTDDMANNHYFSHDIPGDGDVSMLLGTSGIDTTRTFWGENLEKFPGSSEHLSADLVQRWTQSPAHYENMVNPRYTRIGVGVTDSDDGWIYAALVFASD